MKKKLLALLIALTPVLMPYLAFAAESDESTTESADWTVYSNGGCTNASNQGWGGTGPAITSAQSNACLVAYENITSYGQCIALGVGAANCWNGAQNSCIGAC
jgi:hypothetical protein